MAIDSQIFRSTMGHFPTGVSVVTTSHPTVGDFGITISSLTSLSLNPPLVLFCLGTNGHSISVFREVSHFAFNILSQDQGAFSDQFAKRTPIDWECIESSVDEVSGCRLFSGALAHVVCEKFETFPGGDHEIIIGRVIDMQVNRQAQPLVRYTGKYCPLLTTVI